MIDELIVNYFLFFPVFDLEVCPIWEKLCWIWDRWNFVSSVPNHEPIIIDRKQEPCSPDFEQCLAILVLLGKCSPGNLCLCFTITSRRPLIDRLSRYDRHRQENQNRYPLYLRSDTYKWLPLIYNLFSSVDSVAVPAEDDGNHCSMQ